jgi:uncharacterized membrane protein YcjF (UPF0283 family)
MGFFNEIDALKDHALEPFQNEPGKRRFVQIVFVLLCAAVGVGVAWLMGNWTSSPWSLFGYALAIVLLSIFAAIWAIARSSRNYRRYRGLCQELRELQQGTYDQEFVSEEPEIEELNDMERWILGKPEATVDQLAAHPHSSAVLLP